MIVATPRIERIEAQRSTMARVWSCPSESVILRVRFASLAWRTIDDLTCVHCGGVQWSPTKSHGDGLWLFHSGVLIYSVSFAVS